jgi:hypothetical protein
MASLSGRSVRAIRKRIALMRAMIQLDIGKSPDRPYCKATPIEVPIGLLATTRTR